ncbi:hypothetical protein D3C79_603020 [compost metagenome]
MARKNRPIANFTGEFGSLLPSLIQMAATIGASVMMKKGFRDWNQAVGTSKLPIMRSVYS